MLQNINLELEKIILKNGWGFDWFEYTKLESYEKHITVKTFSYPYHTIFSTNLCKSLPEIPVTTVAARVESFRMFCMRPHEKLILIGAYIITSMFITDIYHRTSLFGFHSNSICICISNFNQLWYSINLIFLFLFFYQF